MTFIDMTMAAGLMMALAVNTGNKRAWGWLTAVATSYVVSTLYWRTGLPLAPVVAGLCDAVVCLAAYFMAKRRWEMGVFALMLTSVLVNIVYLAGITVTLPASLSHNAYAATLEAIDWVVLFWIGGTGAFQNAGAGGDSANSAFGRIHRALLPLYRERS